MGEPAQSTIFYLTGSEEGLNGIGVKPLVQNGPPAVIGSTVRIALLLAILCFHFQHTMAGALAGEMQAQIPLTLDEAVKTGLAKNPRIVAAKFKVDASTARITQARSGLYPQIDLSQSFNRTNNPMWAFGTKLNQSAITSEDFDPGRLNDPDPINNYASTLSVTMPIYDAGQFRIGVKQGKLDQEAATLLAQRVRQEVIRDVVISYVGVLLAGYVLQVVDQTLETAGTHHDMIRSRHESGLVVKSDLLRAEVHIAELEQERLNAQSQLDVAKAALNAAMGVEIDGTYELVTSLEPDAETPPSVLQDWIETSLRQRPDLKGMRLQEAAVEQEVKKARMAHLPGLYLSGSYEMDSEDFSETADNYTVGAVMRFNLFSGLAMESKVREAMANLQEAKAIVRQLEQAIDVETRRAFFQTRSAHQRIQVAEAAVAQAQEGLRIVRSRYESGLFTIVNLLDAEVSLQQARTNYLRALHDYKVAMAELKLAQGTIDGAFH